MRLLIYHNRHWKEETKDIKKNDVIVLVNRLSKSVFRDYCEINNVSQEVINTLKYYTLEELLKGELDNMKFDYVIQNPPYSKKIGENGKTKTIWDDIVVKCFELLKDDGSMTSVHPGTWRFSTSNSSNNGLFRVKEIYKNNNVINAEFNDIKKGLETFGVGTDYDVITVQKTQTTENLTILNTKTDKNLKVNLNEFKVLPTDRVELYNRLKAKDDEELVELIFNSSYHHSNGGDKCKVNREKSSIFRYPVVYTILEKEGVVFWYSNTTDKGHFGKTKLILKIGGQKTLLDLKGEYGMTEFAAGIVDTPENLVRIQKAVMSHEFTRLKIYFCGATTTPDKAPIDGLGTLFKFIRTFKKDFWKEFYTEEMEQELIEEGLI